MGSDLVDGYDHVRVRHDMPPCRKHARERGMPAGNQVTVMGLTATAFSMRALRTSSAAHCQLTAVPKQTLSTASRLYRGLGSADFCRLQKGIPPSELRASRPRHHASE